MTHIELSKSAPKKNREALLVALTPEEEGAALYFSPALDVKEAGVLADLANTAGASGKGFEVLRVPGDKVGYEVVVFVGVGDLTSENVRRAAGAVTRVTSGITTLDVALPAGSPDAIGALCEGLLLGSYRFSRYKETKEPIATVRILTELAGSKEASAARDRAVVVAESVNAARELVNTPPNELYPESFANLAVEAGKATGLKVRVLNESELQAGGYGGISAVGRGSARPPRLVKLHYAGKGAKKHIALVGKGITFDSGGLSLKPPASMETMKTDMSGAAAVLNTITAAARLKLPVKVTAWLALAENMPSAHATRPSDVITMLDGTTVEVLNTDAEGRLVLADALVAAGQENPDAILDVATLTGAQVVALGERVSGVMGDEDTRSDIVAASEAAGEDFWPMPLPEYLAETLKSPIADLKNIGARAGGMLTAGHFLKHFVGTTPWAHLDIAGPAHTEKAWGYNSAGGTGVGVRTLIGYLENVSE